MDAITAGELARGDLPRLLQTLEDMRSDVVYARIREQLAAIEAWFCEELDRAIDRLAGEQGGAPGDARRPRADGWLVDRVEEHARRVADAWEGVRSKAERYIRFAFEEDTFANLRRKVAAGEASRLELLARLAAMDSRNRTTRRLDREMLESSDQADVAPLARSPAAILVQECCHGTAADPSRATAAEKRLASGRVAH